MIHAFENSFGNHFSNVVCNLKKKEKEKKKRFKLFKKRKEKTEWAGGGTVKSVEKTEVFGILQHSREDHIAVQAS